MHCIMHCMITHCNALHIALHISLHIALHNFKCSGYLHIIRLNQSAQYNRVAPASSDYCRDQSGRDVIQYDKVINGIGEIWQRAAIIWTEDACHNHKNKSASLIGFEGFNSIVVWPDCYKQGNRNIQCQASLWVWRWLFCDGLHCETWCGLYCGLSGVQRLEGSYQQNQSYAEVCLANELLLTVVCNVDSQSELLMKRSDGVGVRLFQCIRNCITLTSNDPHWLYVIKYHGNI